MIDIKKLDWYYCENFAENKTIKLSSEESRHMKVKRNMPDEYVCVFDGNGKVGIGKIIDKEHIIIEEIQNFPERDYLTIAVAVPKGKRVDVLISKLTELGVDRIIPMKTAYSVVEPSLNKQERWKRILIESCKQCKRAFLPKLEKYSDFFTVSKMNYEFKIILDPYGESIHNFDTSIASHILAVIGPEGGFSADEIIETEKNMFVKIKLNDNILRVETAAIATAAAIMSRKFYKPAVEEIESE